MAALALEDRHKGLRIRLGSDVDRDAVVGINQALVGISAGHGVRQRFQPVAAFERLAEVI